MDLELTDEQHDLQAAVASVLAARCPVSLARHVVEQDPESPAELAGFARTTRELDWQRLNIPVDHGGLGLGLVEVVVLAEQMGRVIAPGPLLATVSQFVPMLTELGSYEQCKRFLAPVAAGDLSGTLALAERPGGFGLQALGAGAVESGGAWTLSGTKSFVMEAGRAEEMVVVARLAGSRAGEGLAAFVVPVAAERVVPMAVIDESRQLARVDLDGMRVEPDRALGVPGECSAGLVRALQQSTVALCAEAVGTCQTVLDTVIAHVSTREQFGVKIGSFQALKHKAADMYLALESARATTYFAAAAIAEDDPRREIATSVAKASVGDCVRLVAEEGIQCLGGIAYTWEHDMHLLVKRAKTASMLFGTTAEHHRRIAGLIGLGGGQRER
jgi:alkylation response protein AidB-like acyl-CoA dehydrogenase